MQALTGLSGLSGLVSGGKPVGPPPAPNELFLHAFSDFRADATVEEGGGLVYSLDFSQDHNSGYLAIL